MFAPMFRSRVHRTSPGPVVLLAVLGAWAAGGTARAATVTIACPGGVGDTASLVAALTAANANGEDDTIQLTPNCAYTVSSASDTSVGSTGFPAIVADGGHSVAIEGNGATIQRSSSGPLLRFFLVSGGALTLSDVTLSGGSTANVSGQAGGGAVEVSSGELVATRVAFRSNQANAQAGGFGGAVFVASGASAVILQSLATGNSATAGGGFYDQAGSLIVANTTIAGNTAAAEGGGVGLDFGAATLVNVTVSGNVALASNASPGPGVAQLAGTFTLTNTIVAANMPNVDDTLGTFTDGGNNLIGASSATFSPSTLKGTSGAPLAAHLGPLQANGGPTDTEALAAASPAIGAANGAACASAPVGGIDQRGFVRPLAACDIGAYQTGASAPDAGGETDAGVSADADAGPETSDASDASAESGASDANVEADASDAAAGADASAAADASAPADAGAPSDATTAADTGAPHDAGAAVDASLSGEDAASPRTDASTDDASVASDSSVPTEGLDAGGEVVGTAAGGSSNGCSCRAGGNRPAGAASAGLAALALLGLRRRRSRRK